MRVVLVGPEFEENLSTRYLSSSLLVAGHDTLLSPFNSEDDSDSVVSACEGADIVGLSMCFQARAPEFLRLAELIRRRFPHLLIVAGGHFASCAARELLENNPPLDLIVIHEGERTLVEIADWHAQSGRPLSTIKGIVYRDGTSIRFTEPRPILDDLDSLPLPDRRGPVRLIAGIPTAYLFGSRGCLNSCDYCCIRTLHSLAPGRLFRQRDPEKIADEMAALYYGRGIRQFIFHDDNFLVPSEEKNHRRLDAFEDAFRRRGFGQIGLYLKCRPGDLTRSVMKRLHSIGLVRLFLGIESSSAMGYSSLGRRQTVEESEAALAACDEHGIHAQFTLLMFHPEATLETMRSDIRFMQNHLNHPFNFGRAELNAGTPLEQRMIQTGQASGSYLGRGYRLTDPTADRVWKVQKAIFTDRCSAEDSLMNKAINLDYLDSAMRRFYDGHQVGELSNEIDGWRREVNISSLELLSRAVEMCAEEGAPGTLRFTRQLAALKRDEALSRERLSAAYERLQQRLNDLTLHMVGLEQRDGRLQRVHGTKATLARHIVAVTLALNIAGAVPAFGCQDMEQRVLDMDHDNLYGDLELQLFGTDPLQADSDMNGVTDDLEDSNGDGVTNIEEQRRIGELVAAARSGKVSEVERLLGEGVNMDIVDPASDHNPLMAAIDSGQQAVIDLLFEKGAKANVKDYYGWTPLMYAALRNDVPTAKRLIEAGADVNASARFAVTPLSIAKPKGSPELIELLKTAGAQE